MTTQQFNEAIQIIAQNNSVKVSFNVPITDNYTSTHQILIHESKPSVIDELIKKGYSLSMTPKGLSVNKFR